MRVNFIKFCFVLGLVLIIGRLFYWQIIKYDDLTAKAEGQHLRNYQSEANRGTIYSSDGSILAVDQPSYTLFTQPMLIKGNKDGIAEELSRLVMAINEKTADEPLSLYINKPIPKDQMKDYLELKNNFFKKLSEELYYVPVVKGISSAEKKEIEDIKIEGVGFENYLSRYYPESSSAANLLGFVGADALGRRIGYFGVEGQYNGELRGVGGQTIEEKDPAGSPILIGKFFQQEPKPGHDLVLNLDRTVQYIVEKSLKKGMEKYGALKGTILVMNPKNGAILALASLPSYDPNNYTDFPKSSFKNSAVADLYEPGSTFKVLVMAAALNEGAVKPDTECDICEGPVTIGEYTVRTWNNRYYPKSKMNEVIVHSDNTGMVYTGRRLGLEKLYQYLENFGFGNLTGIDLQDEDSQNLRPIKDWTEIDLATATFGQGVAVTPIQMIRAVSVIANGGYLYEPQVVSTIKSGQKEVSIKPKIVRRVISPETAKVVTAMMVEAVEKGEAKKFAPIGYKIAGKTGTAQIPILGHYDQNKTIASFVGFAPADNPKFAMLVTYNQPTSSIFGSETAAPTFFEIAKELLIYYKISPS